MATSATPSKPVMRSGSRGLIGSVDTLTPAAFALSISAESRAQTRRSIPAASSVEPRATAQRGAPITNIEGPLCPSIPRRLATSGLRIAEIRTVPATTRKTTGTISSAPFIPLSTSASPKIGAVAAATTPRAESVIIKKRSFHVIANPAVVKTASGLTTKARKATKARPGSPRSITSPMSTFAARRTNKIPSRIGINVSLNSSM